ncbi:MAG: hypothetical protein GYA17_22560 [Chloroflexi bacterium]|jgi:hypothetical protein|nr:hypothetical protein [Anaerolineaceae bacterium]NMB91154.1 hypothetical protein [Chloroflexota bacterium]
MDFLKGLFAKPPYPAQHKQEVERALQDLIQIGKTEDFLSERPGQNFNAQCRHVQARRIGMRLNEIGGLPLMEYIRDQVRRKLGQEIGSHLDYAWSDIGSWIP